MSRASWTLVAVIILIGGALSIWLYVSDTQFFSESGSSSAKHTFAPNWIVTLEDHEDYPAEPRANHPAILHILDSTGVERDTFAVPGIDRDRKVRLTTRHAYYYDADQAQLMSGTDNSVVPDSEVDDPRFGGELAVFETKSAERLAFGRTSGQAGEFILELVVSERVGEEYAQRVVWQRTVEEARRVVPLAWADDGETIYFGTIDASATSGNLDASALEQTLHIRVPKDPAETYEPEELVYPDRNARLLALSGDTNLALFVIPDEPGDEEESTSEDRYIFADVAHNRNQEIHVDLGQHISSAAFGEDFIVLGLDDASGSKLSVINFGVLDPVVRSVSVDQFDVRGVVKNESGDLSAYINSAGVGRGASLVSLGSSAGENKISDFLVVN